MLTSAASVVAGFFVIAASVSLATGAAHADEGDVGGVVSGGSLSLRVDNGTDLILGPNGEPASAGGGERPVWTVIDARGTGQPWAVAVSATDFTSAGGTDESTPQYIDISNLSISSGEVTAGEGSDQSPAPVTLLMSRSPQSFVSSDRAAKGNYRFSPAFAWSGDFDPSVPNHAIGHSGAVNPFITTVTVTVG